MSLAIRWTIGPTTDIGVRMLRLSVRSFRRFHPGQCLIAVNGLQPEFWSAVHGLGVPVYRQTGAEFPIPPKSVAWKLYPPRFFPDRHELMVDNDIVLVRPLPQMERFLRGDAIMYTRSLGRVYGRFRPPDGLHVNSGLIGLPPGYDFAGELLRTLGDKKSWEHHFDEQGCVAETISRHQDLLEVGLEDIGVCHNQVLGQARCGYHFVSSNTRQHNRAWDEFLDRRHKSITNL